MSWRHFICGACLTAALLAGGCASANGASCGDTSGERDAPAIERTSGWGVSGAYACVRRVRQLRPIVHRQAFLLCQGARSTAPAECFYEATRRYFLMEDQAILLCRCAKTVEPVRCFRQARVGWGFLDQDAVEVCSPTVQLGLLFNCRPRAF